MRVQMRMLAVCKKKCNPTIVMLLILVNLTLTSAMWILSESVPGTS